MKLDNIVQGLRNDHNSSSNRQRTIQQKTKKIIIGLSLLFVLTLFTTNVFAQPTPHNIQGRVYLDNGKTTNGPGDLWVVLNNTINHNVTITKTQDPGPPFLRGIYSATIIANDGDYIRATSWNATHYGISNSTLLPSTTTIDIVLNRTRTSEPNISILLPANNSIVNTSDTFNITANISILGNDATGCEVNLSFSSEILNLSEGETYEQNLGDIDLHDHQVANWETNGLKEGNLYITVTASCSSDDVILEGITSLSINLTVEDTSPPEVTLLSPSNNSYVQEDIVLDYNVSENTGLANCSLYVGGILNQTTTGLEPVGDFNFTLNQTAEGSYEWHVSCVDNSSNNNVGTSPTFSLTVDATPPNVTLIFPQNNTQKQDNDVLFSYNISDNFLVGNCFFILNGAVYQTNDSITQNISNNFSVTLIGDEYLWSVNCTDNASNTASSGFFNFNITDPDLKVNNSDITFSTQYFVENDNITIIATIYNIGTDNATDAVIRFFENDPNDGGTQIGDDFVVNITFGSNVSVNTTYVTKMGLVDILVYADPPLETNGSISESNETNNLGNITIDIPPYHLFYGDVVNNVLLDTASQLTVLHWYNATNFTGNLYVADSDSIIDFDSLKALTRNISNNFTPGDIGELDVALNLTNITESLNVSYLEDNLPLAVQNYSILSSTIEEVPVVNSTNSSNFLTGILWDTSDENPGQFNGSQDVVFITRINQHQQGLYGTFDYEINVPANLRKYIVPNLQNSISFYQEIT